MTNNTIVYIIIVLVVAHFLFAVAYLIYKITTAPKNPENLNENTEGSQGDSF